MEPSSEASSSKVSKWEKSQLFLTRFNEKKGFLFIINKLFILFDKYIYMSKILDKNKIDAIYVRNGIFESFLALYFSRKYNIKFSFMLSSMHGFFDDNEILSDYSGKRYYFKLVQSYIRKKAYQYIIPKADLFHPITRWMAKSPSLGIKKDTIVLPIPLCPPSSFLRHKKSNSNFHTLVYLGSLRKSRDLDFMFQIFSSLSSLHSKLNFLIIGNPSKEYSPEYWENLLNKYNLKKSLKITGNIGHYEVPSYVKKNSIGLSAIPPIPKFVVSSPTKCVEYLALGIPVVGNKEIRDQNLMLKESKGGIITNYSVADFVKAISYLVKNPKLAYEMGILGRNWIKENRNYSETTKNLEEILLDD